VHEHEQQPVAVVATPPTAAPSALVRDGLDTDTVISLQRTAGNALVSRLLDPDEPGDPDAPQEGERLPFPAGIELHAEPEEFEAFAQGPRLEGKTTAHWDGLGHFEPDPPKATAAKGCDCPTCMRVRGTFVVTYDSAPTVKLPDVPSGLTDCQRTNAEKFIRDVLAPHEQLHVKAFRTHFDGTTKRPFDLKVCSADELKDKLDPGYTAELEARKVKAQAESDKLDANGANQFTWDMDEGCAP
jgi:hypothetical protein